MAKKQKERVIANPIYDVVFKNLMTTSKGTNKDIASYFVGTILGEEITDIELLPQEYTYHKPKKKMKAQNVADELTLIRLDFVATIHTKSGEYKKVLIEIQKSPKPIDLLRFRTYLGEQYKQIDTITVKENKIEQSLPIVVIYMLGFVLPEIEAIAIKVNRTYVDIICGKEIKNKSPFIESLTHDAYFVQVSRINEDTYLKWESCSELEKMLSLFEQNYFVDENFLKTYPYPITNKNIKKMVETLEYIAADPKVRRIMQEEYWAAQNEILWENQVTILTNEVTTLSNENTTLSNENAELRRILQQAGIMTSA
jgi:hypothetical protein